MISDTSPTNALSFPSEINLTWDARPAITALCLHGDIRRCRLYLGTALPNDCLVLYGLSDIVEAGVDGDDLDELDLLSGSWPFTLLFVCQIILSFFIISPDLFFLLGFPYLYKIKVSKINQTYYCMTNALNIF